jgi:hypothetical protein
VGLLGLLIEIEPDESVLRTSLFEHAGDGCVFWEGVAAGLKSHIHVGSCYFVELQEIFDEVFGLGFGLDFKDDLFDLGGVGFGFAHEHQSHLEHAL